MSFSLIAAYTMRGGVTFTGNTLGLSQQTNAAVMGTAGSIGAFTTLNNASSYSNFPSGTTEFYTQNSSSANLVMPAGSNVEYAVLIWAGNCAIANGESINDGILNNPVSFIVPNNPNVLEIPGTIAFRDSLASGQQFYMRAANVTPYVQAAGSGTYVVGHVPGILNPLNSNTNDTNFAGWTLAVIYRNLSLPLRNMTLYVGGDIVRAASGSSPGNSVTIPIGGFVTPFFGAFNARILLTAGEGDMQISGDQAFFTPPGVALTNPSYALSGPRNLITNFFSSQICDDNGNLDQSGTFGTRNHTSFTQLFTGGRQGWDITNVDASSKMVNGQTSATLYLTTSGDTYLPTGIGLQVDLASINLGISKAVLDGANFVTSKNVQAGEVLTFRVTLTNPDPNITLAPLTVRDSLQSGLLFQPGSVTVNGSPRPADNISASGVVIPSLGPGQAATVTFRAVVQSNAVNPLSNTATATYTYTPAPNYTVNDERASNPVTLNVLRPNVSVSKSVSPTGTVYPGTRLTYTLIVSNLSNFDITGAVLTDPLPTGVTYPGGSTYQQVLGTIPAGQTLPPITIDVIVNETTSGIITNQAFLSYNSVAGAGNTDSLVVTNTVLQPDIQLLKSQSLNYVLENDLVDYTFTITNTSQVPLLNLSLQDILPDGLSLSGDITLTDGSTTTILTGDIESVNGISLNRGLSPGGTLLVTVPVVVTDEAFAPYINDGTIFYSFDTINRGLSTRSETSPEVIMYLSEYPVTVIKSATPPTVSATVPTTVTYTLTITTTSDATDLVITEPAPFANYGTGYAMNYVPGSGNISPNSSGGTITIPASATDPIIITIPYLPAGSTLYATFQATSQVIPGQTGTIGYSNIASYDYTYIQDPLLENPTRVTDEQTNEVIIYQSNAQATIEKTMYLLPLATPPVPVNIIYPDEQILIQITLVNNEPTDSLTSFQIGDIIDENFSYSEQDIQVSLAGTPLTLGTDYTISSTPLSSLTISFDAVLTVAPGETVIVQIPATRMAGSTATTLYNTGISNFVLSSTPADNEIIRTVRMPLTVTDPSLSIVKSASTAVVALNEPILYTILVTNTGSYTMNQVVVTDAVLQSYLDNGILKYASGQPITVDGLPYGGLLPITLGTLTIGQTRTIQIATQLSAPPDNNLISNLAGTTGQTVLARPGAPNNTRTWGPYTAPATVEYLDIEVAIDKTVDKTLAMHGEELLYTVTLTNHSNRTIEQTVLFDTLPDLTNFIPGSVTVNGIPEPAANILNGLLLGSISPQTPGDAPSTITITYKVQIQDIEGDTSAEDIVNAVRSYYTYRRTPTAPGEIGIVGPESVLTELIHPELTAQKAVSNAYAEQGDIITYTIPITNSGDTILTNIILTDMLPNGLTLADSIDIANSSGTYLYSVSGNLITGVTIVGTGLPLTSLMAGETILVTMDALVNSVPPEEFINSASLAYSYTLRNTILTNGTSTNTVLTEGIRQSLIIAKNVIPESVRVGEEVNYTILVQNTGNTPIVNVMITDPLTSNITLNTNYTFVDNVPVYQLITDGITISQINPGQTIPITFTAVLDSVPPEVNLNTSSYYYSYVKDPSVSPILVNTQPTNTVTLLGTTSTSGLTIVKSSNIKTAKPGDIITYTLAVSNAGTLPLTTVVISDPLTEGLTFVPSSVQINGASVSGDITSGITIPALVPNAYIALTFQAQLTTSPLASSYTNTAGATYFYQQGTAVVPGSTSSDPNTITVSTVTNSSLRVEKTANHVLARPGTMVSYTITVTNTGTSPISSLFLTDLLDPRFALNIASIELNGNLTPGNLSRLPLPDLAANESAVITYSGIIDSVANGAPILNTATVTGLTADSAPISAYDSAAIGLYLSYDPRMKAVISVNSSSASVCDVLCYKITLTNISSTTLTNILLSDILNPALAFVPHSLTINGDHCTGGVECLALPDLIPGTYPNTIKFEARIMECPKDGIISNRASVSYKAGGLMFQTQKTNKVRTKISENKK